MLVTIFDSLCTAMGDGMNALLTMFLGMLDMSLSGYLETFPFFELAYRICRGIAWGLLVINASFAMGQYAFGSLDSRQAQDTPAGILIKSFLAAALLLWGGHIVEFAARLAVIPFNEILHIDVADPSFGENFTQGLAIGLIEAVFGTPGAAIDLTIVLFQFLVIVLISWNLLKLMLEICERYVMMGLLVFTAPLIWPAAATNATLGILQRWAGMFTSSCLMMSLSALCMKLILSGFSTLSSGKHIFLRMLYILALCRLSQRMDTYLAQLGLSAAQTGGNLADDLLGAVHTAGRVFSEGGSAPHRGTVLGADRGTVSRFGGIAGAAGDGLRAAGQSYRKDAGIRGMAAAAGKAAVRTYTETTPFGSAAKEVRRAAQAGEPVSGQAKAAVKGLGTGALHGMVRTVRPAAETQRQQYRNVTAEERTRAAAMKVTPDHYSPDPEITGGPAEHELMRYTLQNRPVPQELARRYFEANGVGKEPIREGQDGLTLSREASWAGVQMDRLRERDGLSDRCLLRGDPDAVAETLAGMYGQSGSEAVRETLKTTAEQSSPRVAECTLMDRNFELSGNDALGEACIRKAFDGIVPERAEGIREVRASATPERKMEDGTILNGGRKLTFGYSETSEGFGEPLQHTVQVLDSPAWLGLRTAGGAREGEYLPYTAASGNLYYYRDTFARDGREWNTHEDHVFRTEGQLRLRPADAAAAESVRFRPSAPKWAQIQKKEETHGERK